MQPKNRPYGLLPTHWALRWVVYAVFAALLFGGADALFFDDSAGAAVTRGAAFGVFTATVGIVRERRGLRAPRMSREERNR
jgi:hypothetical protein